MLARIRKAKDNESGFTLIELLVVVIIIGILAAIAIPSFLNQRKNGWEAQAKSSLRNAVTNAESFATTSGGTYVGLTDALAQEGISTANGAVITVGAAPVLSATEFCLNVDHNKLGAAGASIDFHYKKSVDNIVAGACA